MIEDCAIELKKFAEHSKRHNAPANHETLIAISNHLLSMRNYENYKRFQKNSENSILVGTTANGFMGQCAGFVGGEKK